MNKNIFLLMSLSVFFVGCASGHCRGKNDSKARSVYVYKADGSLQCEQGKKISVVEMSKELEGITIRSQSSKTDGRMHMMMCGGATGQINVYEIAEKDLKEALKRGFKDFSELETAGSEGQ